MADVSMVVRSVVGDPPREIARTAWARPLLIFFGALFAFTCGFNFSFNHWYARGPMLLDAGWHSGVIFHRGWDPQSMLIEYPAPRAFFSFHLSPFMSFFGVLSTWFPGDRAMYYCIVHGLVYAPLGAAAATMLPERTRAGEAALAMLSGVCALMSGQALSCMGYPHLEPFVPAAIAMMLAAMVRGQARWAVVWLLLCTTLREDAGFHAASFLFAGLACNVTKRPLPLSTRRLLALTALAFGISVVIFIAQKTLWPGPGLFREEYLGEPAYAHLTSAEMQKRLSEFYERCGYVYAPLVATIVIAIIRRDPRYLLGWLVELPWLLVNILAKQPSKARFELYAGFPFIASAFWVLVYAHVDVMNTKPARFVMLRRWLPYLAVTLLSTVVAWRQGGWLPGVMEDSLVRVTTDRRAVETVANRLRANPNPTGHTRVDVAMAAWTTESIAPKQLITERPPEGLRGTDEFYFFRYGFDSGMYPTWLAQEPALEHCGALGVTPVRWCGRGPLPSGFEAMSPLLERAVVAPSVRRVKHSFVFPQGSADDILILFGLQGMPPGDYRATWAYHADGCADGGGGVFDVWHGGTTIAQTRGAPNGTAATLTFRVAPSEPEGWEMRAAAWRCSVTIDDLRVAVDTPATVSQIGSASARAGASRDALEPLGPRLRKIAESAGTTRIDPALAAWANAVLLRTEELGTPRGLGDAGAVFFFREGAEAQRMLGWLAASPALDHCGMLPSTEALFCGERGLPDGFVPSSPFLARAIIGGVTRTPSGTIAMPAARPSANQDPQIAVWGPFASLLPGDYRATWTYHASGCADDATGLFDVARASIGVANVLGKSTEHDANVVFHVDPTTTERWEFRAFRWPCPVTLDDLRVAPAGGGRIAPENPL